MASRNGTVEKKEIGIAIGTDGTFSNTETIDGKLQLKIKTTNPLEYHKMGLWTSKVIDIGDSFKDYENIILTKTDEDNSYVDIYTRTSANGTVFSPYVKATGGIIASPKNRYIQIRLELHAGGVVEDILIATEDLVGNNKFAEEYIVTPKGSAIPALTSNAQTVSGIPFANSTYGGGNDIWRAFDKTATHYTSAGGVIVGFIGYKFTKNKIIDKYELTSTNITNQTTMVNTWFFEASDDTTNGADGNWTILDSKSGYSWTQAQKREFAIQNNKAFLAYRLRWTANNGNASNTSIGELDMISPDIMGVQLKHDYKSIMAKDSTWTDTGELHRVTVNKSDFLNIKRMEVK